MKSKPKIYLIYLIAGATILGFTINQRCKEKNILLSQLNQKAIQNNELNAATELVKLRQPPKQDSSDWQLSASRKKDEQEKVLSSGVRNPENSLLRLKEYIKSLEAENRELKDRVSELDKLLSIEKEKSKDVEASALLKEKLDKALESEHKAREEFEDKLDVMKAEVREKEREISRVTEDKRSLEFQIYKLTNKLSDVDNSHSDIRRQLAEAQTNKTALETELNKVKGELDKQITLNDTLNKKIAELSANLENKNKEIAGDSYYTFKEKLNQAIELQNKNKEKLDANLDTWKTQLLQKDNQISQLTADKLSIEYQIYELNNKLSDLRSANSALERKTVEAQTNKESVEIDLNKIKQELDKQITLNNTLNKKIAELSGALNNRKKELDFLKSARDNLQSQAEELKINKDDNENQIRQLNAQVRELTSVYEGLKKEFDRVSNLVTKRELEIEDKDKKLAAANISLSEAESKMAILNQELGLIKQRQEKTTEQLNQAISFNNTLKKKLMDAYIELELISAERRLR